MKLLCGNKIRIEIIKKINITSNMLVRGIPRFIIITKKKNNLKNIQQTN